MLHVFSDVLEMLCFHKFTLNLLIVFCKWVQYCCPVIGNELEKIQYSPLSLISLFEVENE